MRTAINVLLAVLPVAEVFSTGAYLGFIRNAALYLWPGLVRSTFTMLGANGGSTARPGECCQWRRRIFVWKTLLWSARSVVGGAGTILSFPDNNACLLGSWMFGLLALNLLFRL